MRLLLAAVLLAGCSKPGAKPCFQIGAEYSNGGVKTRKDGQVATPVEAKAFVVSLSTVGLESFWVSSVQPWACTEGR